MLTKNDFCDYDTCVALKELGYDDSTDLRYNSYGSLGNFLGGIKAPTLYEAQKWLREEKEVYVTVIPEYNDYRPVKGVKYRLEVAHWKDDEFGYETVEWLDEECPHTIITFDSFEEALSEGIKEAVKILKE